MVRGSGRIAFWTIADAVGLEHVVEWQSIGDALRADPQGSRSQNVDLAMSKAGGPAAIFDLNAAPRSFEDFRRAGLCPVLEPGERGDVRDALALRCLAPGADDLPQTRLGLGKRRGLLRGRQHEGAAEAKRSNRMGASHLPEL